MALRVADVQEVVAQYYRISLDDLLGECRVRRLALPRQIAMVLALEFVPRVSASTVARIFGRDHSTLHHAVRRVEEWMRVSPKVERDVQRIRRRLREAEQMPRWPSLAAVVEAAALEVEAA